MEQDDQHKLTFTKMGAWLGLAAYAVLVLMIMSIFIF